MKWMAIEGEKAELWQHMTLAHGIFHVEFKQILVRFRVLGTGTLVNKEFYFKTHENVGKNSWTKTSLVTRVMLA